MFSDQSLQGTTAMVVRMTWGSKPLSISVILFPIARGYFLGKSSD